jgi:GMP synthase (glutamine-hydrolysing)
MDTIAVLDFGGQYTHLIANRVRRLGVYSEIVACDAPAAQLARYRGVILSGGPSSVLDKGSPTVDPAVFSLGIPVLGLCYGHQLMAKLLDGSVCRGAVREYGVAQLTITAEAPLFRGISRAQQVWMSHGDTVEKPALGFTVLATSQDCATAAVGDLKRNLYGLQFHPEVTDTPCGMTLLGNFLDLCNCRREWNSEAFLKEISAAIVEKCRGRSVFLLVSGGVDSTVAFALLNRALGPARVTGLHIDTGLMRHGESADILGYMKKNGFDNLHIVDASEMFLSALEEIGRAHV